MFFRLRIVLMWLLKGGVYQSQRTNLVNVPFMPFKVRVIILGGNNQIELPRQFRGIIGIRIDGYNNKVKINGPFVTSLTKIKIQGDNNIIEVGSSKDASYRIDIFPRLASKCNNAKVIIGDNVTTSNQAWLRVGESGSLLQIGSNTMISWDVTIWNTDCHSILSVDDDQRNTPLNIGRVLQIGNRCWIGKGASILKNVILPNDTIVGMGAVVANKVFDKPYCALVGNPACIVKEGVMWDIRSPSDLLEVNHAE